MKIIDVKVTVWKWDNIPPTQYTKDFKSLDSRSTNMALVQILTDEILQVMLSWVTLSSTRATTHNS